MPKDLLLIAAYVILKKQECVYNVQEVAALLLFMLNVLEDLEYS